MEKDELLLTWKEHGGPPVNGQAESEGFGSLLSQSTVRHQFGGQISRDWNPEGLIVHLTLSLERLGA